jgi:tetratricopeptide (TPR) repeat protein
MTTPWFPALAAAAMAGSTWLVPAQAQPPKNPTRQQVDWCLNDNNAFPPDQQIAGCTAAIASGRGAADVRALSYYLRGTAYFHKRDFDRAIADQNEAIKLDPGLAKAYHARGMAYSVKGNLDGAIADFTEALRLDGRFFEAYVNRGLVHATKDRYDEAVADFTAALEINPDDAKALGNRGIALLVRGDTARADDDIGRALKIDPKVRIRGAIAPEIELLAIPADAKSWPLTVEIETSGATVLIYTPGHPHPVRFDGAKSTKDVPMSGPTFLAVALPLAAQWRVGTSSPAVKQ